MIFEIILLERCIDLEHPWHTAYSTCIVCALCHLLGQLVTLRMSNTHMYDSDQWFYTANKICDSSSHENSQTALRFSAGVTTNNDGTSPLIVKYVCHVCSMDQYCIYVFIANIVNTAVSAQTEGYTVSDKNRNLKISLCYFGFLDTLAG
jgi:hypothetical protein